jgi:ribulose-phosphate 3-epimerase
VNLQKNKFFIAPSLLSANLLRLEEEIVRLKDAGADMLHYDVMDGHYVPNLTFGLPLLKQLADWSVLPVDVHLMISNPDQMAVEYAVAGAKRVSFHPEVSFHPHRLINALKSKGVSAGLALNPATPLELLWPLINDVDFVLVMSVNPGFSGQKFIPSSLERISAIRKKSSSIDISVDGGVDDLTASQLRDAGATTLVSGNYVLKAKSFSEAIAKLRPSQKAK